jgi:hypothetical protein
LNIRPIPSSAKRRLSALFVFLSVVAPRVSPSSPLGRVQARVATFVASTPGTALISLAASLAVMIASCAGVLSIARGAQSLTLLMFMIYGFLITAVGIVVLSSLMITTMVHILLGDDLLNRMRVAAATVEPEYEWVRI